MAKERPPLEEMTLRQLRKVASECGVSRYSRMRKSQLLATIQEIQNTKVSIIGSTTEEAQEQVEAAKFNLGQEDRTGGSLSSVDEGIADLPSGYGQSCIVLMPRDPQWAYTYWDVPNESKEDLRRKGGQQLSIRLYDVTDINLEYQRAHSIQEYPCDELAREWYLPIPVSDRDYLVDIGYRCADGRWLILARSTAVHVPPVYPSDWIEDQFITVNWDENLRGKTFLELVPPTKKIVGGVNPIYDQVFGLAESAESARVAGSIFGSMQQVAGSVQHVAGSVQHVAGSVQHVAGSVQHVTGSVQHVAGSVQHVAGSVQHVAGSVQHVAGSVQHVAGSVQHVAGSVQHVAGSVQHVAGSVQHVAGSVQHVTGSIPHIAGSVQHVAGSVQHVAGSVQHIAGSIPHIAGSVQHIAGSVQHIAGSVQHIAGSVQHIAGSIPHIAGSIPHIAGSVQHIAGSVQHIAGSIPHIAGSVQHIAGSVQHIAGSIPHIAGSVQHMAASIQHVPGSMIGVQAISSYIFPSGVGMWAIPTESGLIGSMSGIGLTASGIGFSASVPVNRPRQFWLVADAELIVYGATEPDATVTIGGQPIKLNPDGTFRFQMSFQDGLIDYPIMAVAVDGEQTRSIHMKFNRETPSRHTNTKEEAVQEWLA